MNKEFKPDSTEPRRKQSLDLAYIYINNPAIIRKATRPTGGIDSVILKQPIYFNCNGEFVDPGSIDMKNNEQVNQYRKKSTIESILKIDKETKPGFWENGVAEGKRSNNDFRQRLSIDNGLLKYIFDISPTNSPTFEHPPNIMVRVLVVYQKNHHPEKASEIVNTVRTTSTLLPLNSDAMRSLQN